MFLMVLLNVMEILVLLEKISFPLNETLKFTTLTNHTIFYNLYAAPIWSNALIYKSRLINLQKVYRKEAILICFAQMLCWC